MLSEILGRGLATYRREFRSIAPIAALVLLPTALLGGIVNELIDGVAWDGAIADVVFATTSVAISGLGYFFLAGVIAEIVVSARSGRPRRSVRALALAIPYATLIGVDLVISGAITIGLELLIVPGLFAAAWLGLAPVVIEIEHCGARESLRRSRRLARGHSWAVLAVLVATLALTTLLALPLKELAEHLVSDTGAEIFGLFAAGVLVKPLGAVIEIELVLELIERGRG